MKNEGKVPVCYRAVSTSSGGAASVRGTGKQPLYPISLERIVGTDNIARAWQKVRSNRGAPGLDGVTIEDFPYHFRECWQEIRTAILGGNYTPKPVLRVEIEKPDGGIRKLGIPTVNSYCTSYCMVSDWFFDWFCILVDCFTTSANSFSF